MNPDEDDDLWRLLGKARPTPVSPFFSRNVLRVIRAEQSEREFSWWVWLRRRSVYAVFATLLIMMIMTTNQNVRVRRLDPIDQAASEVASSPDFNVIANLDDLLASQDNDVWLASFEQ